MKTPPRRKLPIAPAGVAPFLRSVVMGVTRPLSAASTTSTRYPTVLALHTALLVSGALVACGSPEAGDAIHADEHVRTAATAVKTSTAPSASATLGTMAQPFVDPDPHEVDGQRMVVVPPTLPSATTHVITTAPTAAPTWKGPKMAGARPPVRPHPTTTTGAAAGTIGGTPPCPPRDPGAST